VAAKRSEEGSKERASSGPCEDETLCGGGMGRPHEHFLEPSRYVPKCVPNGTSMAFLTPGLIRKAPCPISLRVGVAKMGQQFPHCVFIVSFGSRLRGPWAESRLRRH
jgi:hypothetical protein